MSKSSSEVLLVMRASVGLSIFPVSGKVGEFYACAGVDVQAPAGTPGGECVRVDVSLHNADSAPLLFVLESLRSLQPIAEAGGELVAVVKDFPEFRIVVSAVPGNADSAN